MKFYNWRIFLNTLTYQSLITYQLFHSNHFPYSQSPVSYWLINDTFFLNTCPLFQTLLFPFSIFLRLDILFFTSYLFYLLYLLSIILVPYLLSVNPHPLPYTGTFWPLSLTFYFYTLIFNPPPRHLTFFSFVHYPLSVNAHPLPYTFSSFIPYILSSIFKSPSLTSYHWSFLPYPLSLNPHSLPPNYNALLLNM